MYDTSKQNIDPHTARIDYIAGLVTDMLEDRVPSGERIWAASHLFGVADHAALLAGMRAQNIELAYIAGLMHDLYKFTTGNVERHAEEGAAFARPLLDKSGFARPLLDKSGLFSPKEIETICGAIYYHSDKAHRHLPPDEILKDADVMQSVLSSGTCVVSRKQSERWKSLKKEFGFKL